MAKRTLYARRDLINGEEFVAWAKSQGFETALAPNKLHCTIIYSKTAFEWGGERQLRPINGLLTCKGGTRTLDRLGNEGAVVLRFRSATLRQRCTTMKFYGATSDYPTFKPHITISYNAPDISIASVKPFEKPLLFGPEIFQVIDKDFTSADVLEKSRVKYV